MSSNAYVVALEVAPTVELLPEYFKYVSDAGQNSKLHSEGHPVYPEALCDASLQIGQACGYLVAKQEVEANGLLDGAAQTLDRFTTSLDVLVAQQATILSSLTDLITARNNQVGAKKAYHDLQSTVIRSIGSFRDKANWIRLSSSGQRVTREQLDELGEYEGMEAEQVALASLMGVDGVFALPSLIQHDRSFGGGANHDMVAIGKIADYHSGKPPRFVHRRAEVKAACLDYCDEPSRGARTRQEKTRGALLSNIAILSGHCEGLADVSNLLLRKERGYSTSREEKRHLETVGDRLASIVFNPERKRAGAKPRD